MTHENYYEEIGALTTSTAHLVRAYVIGFVLSLTLTAAAYLLVDGAMFSRDTSFIVLAVLACMQFCVQVVYFLHLGQEGKASFERLVAFVSISFIVLILVFVSLWVMAHLDARMMPAQMESYMARH